MSPEMKLLRAFIDECGMDIKDLPGDNFKVTRRQKKPRTAKEIKYTPDFLKLWDIYPKRAGNNSKQAAFKAFNARIKSGTPFVDIYKGLHRYGAFITGTDRLNTEYVLMASTFFGPQESYLAEWEIPKKKLNKEELEIRLQELKAEPWAKMPGSLDLGALRSFAIEHDYKQPGQITNIDQMLEYKRQLKQQIDDRVKKEL